MEVLRFIRSRGTEPLALLIPDDASHGQELVDLSPALEPERVLRGARFREPSGVELLRGLELDFLIGVHFPLLVPQEVLDLPRRGVLNLHPAYLPWGRGWHTPSWAILEGTPAGATLHFMDEGLDSGDIVDQERLEVLPADTADTLYQRLKRLERAVFERAWPALVDGTYERRPQPEGGSAHRRSELLEERIQRIDLHRPEPPEELLRRLRALSTDRWQEAAWYEVDGRRYRVRLTIAEDGADQ